MYSADRVADKTLLVVRLVCIKHTRPEGPAAVDTHRLTRPSSGVGLSSGMTFVPWLREMNLKATFRACICCCFLRCDPEDYTLQKSEREFTGSVVEAPELTLQP